MAKTTNTPKGRPGVMPTPKRAPNPSTPKPVRLEGKDDVAEEGAKPPVESNDDSTDD